MSDTDRKEVANKVLNPLRKEVREWSDPLRSGFSEWVRLDQDEPRLLAQVRKFAPDIAELFEEARQVFDKKHHLDLIVNRLVDEIVSQYHGILKERGGLGADFEIGTVNFQILRDGGHYEIIYPSWLWKLGMSIQAYVEDYAERSLVPVGKLELRTEVYSRSGGPVHYAGAPRRRNIWLRRSCFYWEQRNPHVSCEDGSIR